MGRGGGGGGHTHTSVFLVRGGQIRVCKIVGGLEFKKKKNVIAFSPSHSSMQIILVFKCFLCFQMLCLYRHILLEYISGEYKSRSLKNCIPLSDKNKMATLEKKQHCIHVDYSNLNDPLPHKINYTLIMCWF